VHPPQKRELLESLRRGIESSIRSALLSGDIIYDGNDEVLTGRTERIEAVFEREVGRVVPFIYTKFDDARFKVNEKSIKSILSATEGLNQIEKELELFGENGNLNLHGKILNEVYTMIKTSNDRGDILTGANLLNYFEDVPYGWDVILVRIAVAALFRGAAIYLKYDGKDYYDYKKQEAQELLTNSNKFKKSTLWIEPEVEIRSEEREKIQQNLNVIFNVKSDDTINSLSRNVDVQLADMVAEYEKQKIFWEENGYEVKPVFYTIKETCSKVLYETNPAKKLKKFLEIADEAKKEYQYIKEIKDFKDREDRKLLSRIKKLPPGLNVSSRSIAPELLEEYRNYLSEIETVVSNKEIVEKWPVILENYNRAVEKYKQVYDMLHSERNSVYTDMINEIKSDPVLAASIKEDSFEPVRPYLCPENSWDADDLRCRKCGSTLSELDNHILAKGNIRDDIVLKLTPKEPEEKRIRVNLKSSSGKTVIRSHDDLKEALSNIEKKVKGHLDRGETVILQ